MKDDFEYCGISGYLWIFIIIMVILEFKEKLVVLIVLAIIIIPLIQIFRIVRKKDESSPIPKDLHFSSKTNEEEKEKIKNETFFRYYWAEKFDSDNFLKPELLKYEHPNEVINTALNLEYAMGYRGYYDDTWIENDDYSILEEIEKCRNNPRYFTISYYCNYYNNGDNIFALKGQEMSLGQLMTKLVSMQFLPKIEPDFDKYDSTRSPKTDNYNSCIKFGHDRIGEHLIDEDSRVDYRYNKYCTITLDARDALASNTIPESLLFPNDKDIDMRKTHHVYKEDKRVILTVDLPSSSIICREGIPFQTKTKAKILDVCCNSTDRLHTKEEIEEYRKELQELKEKFEQETKIRCRKIK